MNKPHSTRSLTGLCLLAAAATPVLYVGTQIAAVPFYPGYSSSLLSVSMLGTRFSRHPWIFNAGEILTGLAALGGAFGLYQSFRNKTHVLICWLIAFSVASAGVMTVKAGMFPMPDPRHNSWGWLFNFTILMPFVMLMGLLKQRRNAGLRAYLIGSIALLVLLIPLKPRLGPGALQQLIALATLFPVGVVGFFFRRELHRGSSGQVPSQSSRSS